MKKLLVMSFLTVFVLSNVCMARTENNQARSNTRINHVREIQQPAQQRQGMAAAKINYSQEFYKPVGKENLKNNYIQDKK